MRALADRPTPPRAARRAEEGAQLRLASKSLGCLQRALELADGRLLVARAQQRPGRTWSAASADRVQRERLPQLHDGAGKSRVSISAVPISRWAFRRFAGVEDPVEIDLRALALAGAEQRGTEHVTERQVVWRTAPRAARAGRSPAGPRPAAAARPPGAAGAGVVGLAASTASSCASRRELRGLVVGQREVEAKRRLVRLDPERRAVLLDCLVVPSELDVGGAKVRSHVGTVRAGGAARPCMRRWRPSGRRPRAAEPPARPACRTQARGLLRRSRAAASQTRAGPQGRGTHGGKSLEWESHWMPSGNGSRIANPGESDGPFERSNPQKKKGGRLAALPLDVVEPTRVLEVVLQHELDHPPAALQVDLPEVVDRVSGCTGSHRSDRRRCPPRRRRRSGTPLTVTLHRCRGPGRCRPPSWW